MLEIKTNLGDIRFSKNVMLKIVEDAISLCDGSVYLCNYKGKYKNVMRSSEEMIFAETPEGVEITIFVVVRFGTSIKQNSRKIIDYIYDNVEKVMGERPQKVTMIVTGVQSREIARRYIVIE